MGMSGDTALIQAKRYVDKTLKGQGALKGQDGFSPTITENADNTDKVYKLDITTADSAFTTPNLRGKDGEGSGGGEANVIESISVNGTHISVDENKNVDITVPSIDGLAKTEDIPTKVSELTNDSGYLTEHQDISGKVDKVEGKSLISDAEIARLASVDNYDDTDIKAEIAKKADTTSIPRKVSVLENDSKYQTESDVTTTLSDYATKTYVGEQIANEEHLKREIVTVLPSDTEASDNIIYMLKVESATGNDKYQEYMKIDGTVQMVGDTSVDLTDYAKSAEIPTTVAELTDSADYAKTADVNDSISALQTDKANTSDLTAHTGDSVIHVTAENKTLWNTVSNKVNKEDGKALLADTDKTNYDDAVTKAHTHENKEVLDGITSDKVTAWDNKSDFSGSYNDLNDKPSAEDIGALPKDGNATSATKATNDGDGNNIAETYATKEELNRKFRTVYSFHINGNESNPSDAVTYLDDAVGMTPAYMDFTNDKFNYGSWGNAFFMPKPCMLKYDGTLDYYLDPNDYSKKNDGTASDIADMSYEGNAMIEWGAGGKIWYKIIPDSNDQSSATISFANAKMDSDYVDWSFHNYNGNVVDRFYTPIYNGSTDGTRLRSMSGQVCIQNKNAQKEIGLAKANNIGGNSIWYTEILPDVQLVNLLLVLIGKSLDTQSVFGRGNDSGYVNDSSKNYGMLNSGTMDAKGMFWGSNDGHSGVKVFGMENWWGNQFRRYAGDINEYGSHKVKYTYGTEDGSTEIGFNKTGQGYKVTNEVLPSVMGSYIQKMKFVKNGMSPLTASGTSSTYYCDGLWTSNAQVNYAMRGGYCDYGAPCGAFCLFLNNAPSNEGWYTGASLSCKPLA